MNEQQYNQLCEVFDNLLLDPDASIARIANHRLHIIREHPCYLEQYSCLFDNNTSFRFRLLKLKLITILKKLYKLSQALLSSSDTNYKKNSKNSYQFDILFISHLLNKQQLEQENDFYFADVPAQLKKLSKNYLISFFNHIDHPVSSSSLKNNKLVFKNTLNLKKELELFKIQYLDYKKLLRLAKKEKNILKKKCYQFAAISALDPDTATALRLAIQVKELLNQNPNTKYLITTCEGHSWERMVYATAKSVSSKIKTIGYQHAVLFPKQHAIKNKLPEPYNPDYIFTSGENGKHILSSSPISECSIIKILGTSRIINNPNNFIDTLDQNKENKFNIPTCLILPEGIYSECEVLLSFAANYLEKYSNVKFILRLHPAVNLNLILKKYYHLRLLLDNKNFELSDNIKNTLEQDFSRSNLVLYRGSTAVIQAIQHGLYPIYLAKANEMSIDPLYKLSDWKSNIKTVNEFYMAIDNFIGLEKESKLKQMSSAQNYCHNMFKQLNYDNLFEVL